MKRIGKIAILITHIFTIAPLVASGEPPSDTGQTKCYNNSGETPCPEISEAFYGQDANYVINPMSFTKLDESGNDLSDDATSWAMVRDNVTGLIWEVKNDVDLSQDYNNPHDPENHYTWYDSNPETNGGNAGTSGDRTDTEDVINALNTSNFGGYSDWRLPSIKELVSILDMKQIDPIVNATINSDYFPNTMSSYWSSTTYAEDSSRAWIIDFPYGEAINTPKSNSSNYVRAVRGEQFQSLGHLVDNSDGTVTDTSTGLMWQKDIAPEGDYTWEQAISYCEELDFSDYSDWRLPTFKELISIIEYGQFNPAINDELFPGTVASNYWTSTTSIYNSYDARLVSFYSGRDYEHGGIKTSTYYVRAVRGGQPRSLGHLIIWTPKQGESWEKGNTETITWDTLGFPGNVEIKISRNGGKTFTESLTSSSPNDGSFDWVISGDAGHNCVLKIIPLNDTAMMTTQGLFTIYAPLLSGTVTDSSSGNPLPGVSVAADSEARTVTDNSGFYDFLGEGTYTLTFSKTGYRPVTIQNVVLTGGNSTVIDTELTPISMTWLPLLLDN